MTSLTVLEAPKKKVCTTRTDDNIFSARASLFLCARIDDDMLRRARGGRKMCYMGTMTFVLYFPVIGIDEEFPMMMMMMRALDIIVHIERESHLLT